MKKPFLTASRRVSRTPFSDGIEKSNVSAYTVYNRTLLASEFHNYEEDYHHLKQFVQLWDVSCQKQISVKGEDAEQLMRLLSPRDLTKMDVDQCFYIPLIDKTGGLLNDPVVLKTGQSEYWISIADSDYLLYALGVSDALDLKVEICEAKVFPLAIQGPKSEDLMVKAFGPQINKIRFFRHKRIKFQNHYLIIARSGFSKQGGFEIYLDKPEIAIDLWDFLMEQGKEFNVRAGCPNLIERIEGGLLSYGNDITRDNTPYEAGLGKFINSKDEFIGQDNLMKRPFTKIIAPISIEGEIPPCDRLWPVNYNGKCVGQITSAAFSPDFKTNVAIGMIDKVIIENKNRIEVNTQKDTYCAAIQSRFWL